MSLGRCRLRILLVLLVLVVLGGVGDTLAGGTSTAGQGSLAVVARGSTTLAPVSAISSSWYCDIATAALPGGSTKANLTTADLITAKPSPAKPASPKPTKPASTPTAGAQTAPAIALANTGPTAVPGTISVVGEMGSTASVAVSVPAHGETRVDESRLVKGPDVAATVVLDGGGVAVEQLVTVGNALTVNPCASSLSTSWYFASGSTQGSNQLLVALYNPLPTSAVTDLSFATNAGPASPSDDQNIVVPPRSQVVINVGAHVQQRSLVATTVTVLDGRLVADEVQSRAVSGSSELTVTLGASAPATTWDLPAGVVAKGAAEKLDIYNPSSGSADVQVGLDLSFGSAVPISLSVAPGAVAEVDAVHQHRITVNSLFGVQVSSTNGVGVVVERSFVDSPPQTQQGITDTIGATPAPRWVLAAGAPTGSAPNRVVVENPGTAPIRVSVTAMSGGAAEPAPVLGDAVVGPGRPLTLPLSRAALRLPLVISADGPIVVEQDLVGPHGQGVSSVLGEPAG